MKQLKVRRRGFYMTVFMLMALVFTGAGFEENRASELQSTDIFSKHLKFKQ